MYGAHIEVFDVSGAPNFEACRFLPSWNLENDSPPPLFEFFFGNESWRDFCWHVCVFF